jgi:hypothetical protein
MTDAPRSLDLPAGGRGNSWVALKEIRAILKWRRCANRDIQYLIDGSQEVTAAEFEAWIKESETLGFTEINYSVDHRGRGPVVVNAWASDVSLNSRDDG